MRTRYDSTGRPVAYQMTDEEKAALRFAPGFVEMTSTVRGDVYRDETGARYYITKEVPRCQSATKAGRQCSRSAIDESGRILLDVDIPRCAQHGGG